MSEQFLWISENTKKNKPKQQPKAGVLTQGGCVAIKTIGLPKNGQAQLVWEGCMTATFYESFNSNAAKAVWNANPNAFTPGGYPADPNGSGLLVITDPYGNVQSRFPYAKGLVFALDNKAISGGSYYTMTCPKKNSTFRAQPLSLKSHDIEVTIPGSVYGGPSTDCGLGGPPKKSVTPK